MKKEYIDGCRRNGITKNFDKMTMKDVQRAFEMFDLDKDGLIDWNEFRFAFSYMGATDFCQTMSIENVRNCFKNFDIDANGIISINEYIAGCRRTNSEATVEQLKKAFAIFDLDHNGIIDYKEFYCAMNYLAGFKK